MPLVLSGAAHCSRDLESKTLAIKRVALEIEKSSAYSVSFPQPLTLHDCKDVCKLWPRRVEVGPPVVRQACRAGRSGPSDGEMGN